MAALLTYCKHDIIIVQKLFLMLQYLLVKDNVLNENYKEVIIKEVKNLKVDALANHKNASDIEVINNCIKRLEIANPTKHEF